MLKQIVSYTDFFDVECEDTLYFNISKTELADNFALQDQLENIVKLFNGPKRDLTIPEVQTMIELVKTFIQLSYGLRSSDGKRFIKRPELWLEFTETAAYDAFLFSLFQNPEKMYAFMLGVLPSDLREQVNTEARKNQPDLFAELPPVTNDSTSATVPTPSKNSEEDSRPAWVRENRSPTKAELMSMSEAELAELYRQKVTAS